ncbi:hypothetical protein DSO57_1009796 [Entomophthora muscae]|uniref:Uncharacterized protein n=1 Tax=Entomophthora muscae TaxID=34485 RepID=A0ACC2RXT0_9FUNG|nr:hypothetical protein DSO57_1009796 [Entomophthora muscae]
MRSEELSYMIYDKKLLTVVESMKYWQNHLCSATHPFIGINNHLADSLSCNPAFLPDVKAEQEFNTKVMVPPSAILSSPPMETICTLSVQEPANPDLVARVKLLQPLDKQYPQLFKLANQSTPHTCYSSEDCTILHNGCLWVPDGDICLEVIKAYNNNILVGHQRKNKTI